MREIIEIIHKESLVSQEGKNYVRTHATLDDGTEAVGFGPDFKVGDLVECFFHRGVIKIRKHSIDIK